MDRAGVFVMVLACSLAWAGCTNESAVRHRRDVVRGNNDSLAIAVKHDVVEMKKAGIGDDVVINLLRVSHSYFPVSTRDVVELADSGVSDSVINAMILGFKEESRDRPSGALTYYSPYYWGSAYWYPWDPYFSFGLGYYEPVYGYRGYLPGSYVGWRGGFTSFHGHGHAGFGGRGRR
jgi:hypothetical protein